MRNIFMRFQTVLLFFMVLLSGTLTAKAADDTQTDNRPLYYDSGSEDKTSGTEMKEARALVGPHCMVNRVFNTVNVGTMTHNLDNLTDEDISNSASFPSLVNVGVAYSPLVSVRDMSRRYAAGTTAGYRVVYSSGSSAVKLDLGNAFALKFFYKGKPVVDPKTGKDADAVSATAGNTITGVNLSLIQIPGSDNMCFDVSAAAPAEFDEVELVSIKGLTADVISNIKLKYAFVGKPKTYSITTGDAKTSDQLSGDKTLPNLANYKDDEGRTLSSPSITTDDLISDNVIDEDLTNGKAYGVLLGLAWIGHVKVLTHPADGKEMFPAGSTVGFKIGGLSALNLSLGYTVVITTRDLKGNKQEEATAGSSVLGLDVIKGGSDGGTVQFETKKPFSTFSVNIYGVTVNVGGNLIKYGYVKPAPTIEHLCPIRVSADMNICDSRHTVVLNHNDSIPVTWSRVSVKKVAKDGTETAITNSPATINSNGVVTNMTDNLTAEEVKEGYKIVYTFRATAADGDYEDVKINRGVVQTSDLATCVTPIKSTTNGKTIEFAANSHGGVALLSISEINDRDNILDGKQDTYATVIDGARIGSNVEVVGIKTKDGSSFRKLLPEADQNDSIRVGFVAQVTTTGLTLKLLHGFAVKCYKNGTEVCNRLVSQSDVLGLGLIGSNKVQKINLAITVPYKDEKGNVIDFDEITLWSGGLLDLSASKLNIYYPFIESGDSAKVANCENPLGCDPVIVSNENTNATVLTGGASIDHDNTGSIGTVDAGSFMENLTNAVDNDLTTACTFGAVAKVGGGYKLAINLGKTLDYRHQLGIVMDKQDDKVLEAEVGGWLTIETYRKGKPTGDKKTDWKVLGADVLTMNDKQNIYLMNPKKEYDEVVITLAAVADVLKFQKIYGIVLQSDVDGDGIPDCKDESSCTSTISDVKTNEICQNEPLSVTFKGKSGTQFLISLPEQGIEYQQVPIPSNTNTEDITYTYPTTAKVCGLCKLLIYDENKNLLNDTTYYVHPLITKWRTNAIDTNWGNENNWTNGTPYTCTDVIIPSGAAKWPVLTTTGTNGCKDIHFMANSAVENVFRLNYSKAWVDLAINKDQTLYIAPLQETKSGDLYVIKDDSLSDYSAFTPLTATLAPENRFSPIIYQRVWKSAQEENMHSDGSTTNTSIIPTSATTKYATWSHNFNALNTDYSLIKNNNSWTGKCFSLASIYNDGTEKEDVIRLPKDGTRTYYYYNSLGDPLTNLSASVEHTDKAYRFGYEAALPDNGDGSFTIHYSHDKAASDVTEDGVFLVGNPMMSHLVISKLTAANSSISSLSTWNGQSDINTIVIIDGQPVGTKEDVTTIAPAHAFFVQSSNTSNTTLDLTYNTSMFDPTATDGKAKRLTNESNPFAALRILASADSVKAGTLLLQGRDNKAATILDSEVQPKIAIFTVSDGKSFDVQPVNGDVIPLGIIAKDSVTLSFQTIGNFDLSEWKLRDLTTGFSYDLDSPVKIAVDGTTIGRYVLTRGNATNIDQRLATDGVTLNVANGIATVTSDNDDITAVYSYDDGGSLVDQKLLNNGRQATLHVAPGVDIVKVCRAGKADRTYKVMGR